MKPYAWSQACFHQGAIWGGFVPLLLTYFATPYNLGYAIPMMIGTCVGALSFALSLVLAPETKGKVLQADLVVA
jgi:MFS transporter, SHS family, lactate transporter